jgi:hypothetical protein
LGLAYLPDGSLIDYKEYIARHPRWQKVRQARFDFDDGRCVICHKDLHGRSYQTHHLHYQRLGHERLRDVVTLCNACHMEFHESCQRNQFWKGKEHRHWEVYSLDHTAELCRRIWRNDRLISKDPAAINLCNRDVIKQLLDEYFRTADLSSHPVIDPNDISLFVRNKRYELFFEAEARGLGVEEFLNEYYGKKERGKNPLRQEAGRKNGPFDHTPASFHKNYLENKNLNILMEKVNELEETK